VKGNVFIISGHRVRKIGRDGTIMTVAGGGSIYGKDGIAATSASLASPSALAVDLPGNLYIVDTATKVAGGAVVRKVSADG
jgi:hypothetical protein